MDKIPTPPIPRQMFVPLSFWTDIIVHLDKKLEMISTQYGFGMAGLEIKVHQEKIFEVNFKEETRLRGLLDKAAKVGVANTPQSSDLLNKQSPQVIAKEKPVT